MTQFKAESLNQMNKCIQRAGVDTKITDLRVLCIVIRNAQKTSRLPVENKNQLKI